MRILPPFLLLTASLLSACGSGTRVVYVPVSTLPAPKPAPLPPPPVAVTIARVEDQRLLLSTNQPVYVAAFEIVPGRGLTLMYPTTTRQRQHTLTGSNWLNVLRWSPSDERSERSSRYDREDRYSRYDRRDRRAITERHIYVIASERPLRLSDDAFDDEYLRDVIGPRAYRADEPYETMTALARRFVPPEKDEAWGEDLLTMEVARPTIVMRVAKVYCPDGSVTYVREEMADHAVCPYRGRQDGPSASPPRPDSVVAWNGRPIDVPRGGATGVPPIFRVPRPMQPTAPATNPVVEQQGERRGLSPDSGRTGNGDAPKDENGAKRRRGQPGEHPGGNDDDRQKGKHDDEQRGSGQTGDTPRKPQSNDDQRGKPESGDEQRGKGQSDDDRRKRDQKPSAQSEPKADDDASKQEPRDARNARNRGRDNLKRAAADSTAP